MNKTQKAIREECGAIAALLIEKNRKYGNSALEPARVFSKAPADEQLLVRMDDKISRIKAADPDDQEDALFDLLGYLVLYRVQQRLARKKEETPEEQYKRGFDTFCRCCDAAVAVGNRGIFTEAGSRMRVVQNVCLQCGEVSQYTIDLARGEVLNG